MIPFREKGVPAVLQIEDKSHEFNDQYHRMGDTVSNMNLDYWHAQIRAFVAIAAELAVPVDPSLVTRTPPTPEPTATGTPTPTDVATAEPTASATLEQRETPTELPSATPTERPTSLPTPWQTPVSSPSAVPSATATSQPTAPVPTGRNLYLPAILYR